MTNAPSGSGAPPAPVAPIPRRAIAYVIDAAIAGVLCVIAAVVASIIAGIILGTGGARGASTAPAVLLAGLGITLLVMLAWFLVYSLLQGSGGSVGMRIMRLRLVREGSAAPLGFGRALLRNLVFGLSAAIVVGYFTPLFDGSGRFQGWHDRAAGALMRDVRGATAPVPAAGSPTAAAAAPAAPAAPTAAAAPAVPGDSPFAGPTVVGTAAARAQEMVEVDPHDATVLSPAARALADAPQEDAMITVVPGVSPSVPAPAPAPVSGPETVTAPQPPRPAAPPASVAAAMALPPLAQPAADEDLDETRISIPGHRLQFVWDDGARATVSGRTLFGRNPAPEAGATVVVVRDETLSLSKTHFEAAAEAAGGWVMDRRSTNGMTIVRDGVRIACPPGERVRIRLGDAIEIGDRIVTVGGYA